MLFGGAVQLRGRCWWGPVNPIGRGTRGLLALMSVMKIRVEEADEAARLLDVPQVRWPRPPSSLYPAPAPATATALPAPAAASPTPRVTPENNPLHQRKSPPVLHCARPAMFRLAASGSPVGCSWMRTLHPHAL